MPLAGGLVGLGQPLAPDLAPPTLTMPFISRLIETVKPNRALNAAPAGLLALAVQRATTIEMLEPSSTQTMRDISQQSATPLLQLQRLDQIESVPSQPQQPLAQLEPSAMPLISTPPAVSTAATSSPIQRTETEQPESNDNQATSHQPNPAQMEQLAREVYARLRRRLRIDRERRG